MLVVNKIIGRFAVRIENVLVYITFVLGLKKKNINKEKVTFCFAKILAIASPINAGFRTTLIPALSRAAILDLISPL